jgi:uncharacterized protein YukE
MPVDVWLPEIPGDPAGMRALAGLLGSLAAEIGAQESELTSEVRAMTFEGPAGDAFRERMRGVAADGRSVAEELQDLANLLERSAAEVAEAQKARLERMEQLRREAAEAMANAK